MKSAALRKIFNIVSTIIVIIVVVIAVFLMGSRLVGLNVYNVISGSMEPTYSVGDLIYVKTVDYEDVAEKVKVDDPITFVLNEDKVVATHRVVRIDAKEELIYTKGDTNNTIDPAVHFKNVIGKPIFSIPLLGYVSAFMQTTTGMIVTISLGALLILIVFLPDFFGKKKMTETPVEITDEVSATEETDDPSTNLDETEEK
ncbi:MAG: signal peptidase I [Clostridia bacterium]|nr:signal peptidase I [Clostridia bacterium]